MSTNKETSTLGALEGGLDGMPASTALVRDLVSLIERPLSAILANTEFASSVLAGALQAPSGADGTEMGSATSTALSAVLEASGSAREISVIVHRLRDAPQRGERRMEPREALDGAPRPTTTHELGTTRSMQRPRVLVIDDDVRVGTAIQRSLQDHYEVLLETSPHTAVYRLLLGEECDVILCDIMMPGMTGIEVFKAIGASRRELVPRFVFMSGGTRLPETAEFFGHSSHVLVQKPFTTPDLTNAIEGIIRLTKGSW